MHWPFLNHLVESGKLQIIDLYFAEMALQKLQSSEQEHAALLSALFALSRQGHLALNSDSIQNFFPEEEMQKLLRAGAATFPLSGIEEVNEQSPQTSRYIYRQGSLYYLQKNWIIENEILTHLMRLEQGAFFPLTSAPSSLANALQQQAITFACMYPLSLLTGGPGTGKTFTAAEIICSLLAPLSEKEQEEFHIILSAPTGKAVAQLENALKRTLRVCPRIESGTLHSLLGIKSAVKEWSDKTELHADLIIVDECSMIDAYIFAKLLRAIPEGARLVLIGDKHQLPPVEAGSVFADLVDSHFFKTTELTECLRSDRLSLLNFAQKIQAGDTEQALDLLRQADQDVQWCDLSPESLWQTFGGRFFSFYQEMPDPAVLLGQLNRFAILSCMRKGRWGVDALNRSFMQQLAKQIPPDAAFWTIPIMITRNHYELELFNGDIGIIVRTLNSSLEDFAYFPDPVHALSYRKITALALPSYEYCYALSVHKSQGSEYDEVLILATEGAENFGREVLYTAITRARKRVYLMSVEDVLKKAIASSSLKQSGIQEHLKNSRLQKTI